MEYLRGLFSDDNFNAGTLKAPPETTIRVLTPDVVLVSAHLQVEGQKLVGGGEIEGGTTTPSGSCNAKATDRG